MMTRPLLIEKASEIGLCFGVRRAISIAETVAKERGGVETLGAIAHNQQVVQRLAEIGVRVAKDIEDIRGDTVVISTHGIGPQLGERIRARRINVVNATCPFVRRAQLAARRLTRSDFWVLIYGDADHTEVKGILAWGNGKGMATRDASFVEKLDHLPRHLGVLSQTTQVPASFTQFVKRLIDFALTKDSELRIIDTICHDTRKRQAATVELAHRSDLMLIIGSHTSANTNRLAELCSAITETYLVQSAVEIQPAWLMGRRHIGITAGASTSELTIDEVTTRLEALAQTL